MNLYDKANFYLGLNPKRFGKEMIFLTNFQNVSENIVMINKQKKV